MIPFLIISGIVLLFIATANVTEAPQTIDAAGSSYTAPALDNAVPVVHGSRPSNMRTDSGQVTRSNTTTPVNNHTGSVLAPVSSQRTVSDKSSSIDSSGGYVPPPANNPVSKPERSAPAPVTAPVSVSSRR